MTKSEIITKLTEALELAEQLPDEPAPETDPWRGKWPGPDPLPTGEPAIKETIRPVGDPPWFIDEPGHHQLDTDINADWRYAIVVRSPDVHIHGNGHVVQSAGADNPQNIQCGVNVVHLYSSDSNPDDQAAGLHMSSMKRANNCTIENLTIRANNADTRFFQAVGGYSVVGTRLENCLLEGRGTDGRAFGLRYGGLTANNCVFISRMHDTVNRHQSPACIQAERVVLDKCVIYGGSGGIFLKGKAEGTSEITRCVIANVGIGANAYGLMRGSRVSCHENVFLAVHGLGARGVLVQDEAQENIYADNVFLCWNRGNDEFDWQYASALRFRNGATGVEFARNYVLCLGGGPEGSDSDFRYAVPVRSTITQGMGRNYILGNYLGALTTDPPGELMHHQGLKGAACIGHHDKVFPVESQVIDDNILESNGYVWSLSGWEGTAHQSGSQRNNKIVRNRTPHDMITAFKLARDAKLDQIEMFDNPWVQWIRKESNRVLNQYAKHLPDVPNNPTLFHSGAREGDERITILGSGDIMLADVQPRHENATGQRVVAVGVSEPERWFGRSETTGPYTEHEGPPPE